jgi:hypothetical protein
LEGLEFSCWKLRTVLRAWSWNRYGIRPKRARTIHSIQDVCVSENGDLFSVGTTEGRIDGIHPMGAFLIKMELETRTTVWKVQLHRVM